MNLFDVMRKITNKPDITQRELQITWAQFRQTKFLSEGTTEQRVHQN